MTQHDSTLSDDLEIQELGRCAECGADTGVRPLCANCDLAHTLENTPEWFLRGENPYEDPMLWPEPSDDELVIDDEEDLEGSLPF